MIRVHTPEGPHPIDFTAVGHWQVSAEAALILWTEDLALIAVFAPGQWSWLEVKS